MLFYYLFSNNKKPKMMKDATQKMMARSIYSQLYTQFKLGSTVLLVIMWLIFIITTGIIIGNSVDVATYFLSIVMLLVFLIGIPLYYGYLRGLYTQESFKNTVHAIMIILPLLVLITSSISYNNEKLTEDEKVKAKTCYNASVALVSISVLYYGAITGLYQVNKDMTIFSLAVKDNIY
jgi:hypothetical protein